MRRLAVRRRRVGVVGSAAEPRAVVLLLARPVADAEDVAAAVALVAGAVLLLRLTRELPAVRAGRRLRLVPARDPWTIRMVLLLRHQRRRCKRGSTR